MVVTDENPPASIDVTRPSVARVYDYWLGGKDNFASDREMGWRMAEVNPALPQLVRHNREFICTAAARAAAAGVSQFLDLGSGLPASPAVHEAVREVIPDARVCYVDIDPVALLHGQSLLARGEGLAAVQADLTEPETVLANPQVRAVIDMSRPIAVILAAVLHFLPADSAAAVCAGYMSRAARGSWLIVSSGHYEDKELAAGCSRPPRIPGSGTMTPRIWRRCWPGWSPSGRECAKYTDGWQGQAANRRENPCTRSPPSASSHGNGPHARLCSTGVLKNSPRRASAAPELGGRSPSTAGFYWLKVRADGPHTVRTF